MFQACGSGPTTTAEEAAAIFTQSVQTVAARLTLTSASAPDTPTPTITPDRTGTPIFTLTQQRNGTTTPTLTTTPFSTPPTGGGETGCDSLWVGTVGLENFAEVPAGSQFTKTWVLRNTGICTWSTSFQIAYGWGEHMEGQNTYLPIQVEPGEEVEASVLLTAPTTPGQYGAYWRLRTDGQIFFGETVVVIINVP